MTFFKVPRSSVLQELAAKGDGYAGGHYRAVVRLDNIADTFIDMSKWTKGVLYVNGRNLGRY